MKNGREYEEEEKGEKLEKDEMVWEEKINGNQNKQNTGMQSITCQ